MVVCAPLRKRQAKPVVNRLRCGCYALLGAWAVTSTAQAAEVRTVSRTQGEGYMVRVPGGDDDQLLRRRRLVQYVQLGVYNLLPPKVPGARVRDRDREGQLQLVSSLRLRHDFGSYLRSGNDFAASSQQSIDGRQIDLLFGYLEGQRLGSFLDLRAGRQFEMSGLDFYAFDGIWLRAHTPAYFALETFTGLAVDGTDIFGYPTFELDGTTDTPADRSRSWMVGAAVATDGLRHIDARLAWRRTLSTTLLNPNIVNEDGTTGLPGGIDQDIVSASIAGRFFSNKLTPYSAVRLNLARLRIDDVTAGINFAFTKIHSIRALYIRTSPQFDTDSVFNIFSFQPVDDVRFVYQITPGKRWTLAARGQMRMFHNETTAQGTEPLQSITPGYGGGLAAAFRIPRFRIRADTYAIGGEGGLRVGGSLDTRTMVAWNRLAIDARTYGLYYRDPVVQDRQGWSFAVQAGLNAQLWRGVHIGLLGEEMVSSFYKTAFRMFGTISFDWGVRVGR